MKLGALPFELRLGLLTSRAANDVMGLIQFRFNQFPSQVAAP